jgi:hypothetical protein
MITIEQAMLLSHGDVIHQNDDENADGTCVRWRVSGKIKLWKTRPLEFRVPLKYGMYDNGEITHRNAHLFHMPKDGKEQERCAL